MSGIMTLAALVGLSYYFVNNMNQTSNGDYTQIDQFDWILKKYAKIYNVSWRVLKAHIGAATDYAMASFAKSDNDKPWGQNRLGVMGMRADDFQYVNGILKTNLKSEDRVSSLVSIEYGAAFLKIVNAKYPNDHNNSVIAFYLGLDKQGVAESGDIFSWQEYLGRFNDEYAKIIQRQDE